MVQLAEAASPHNEPSSRSALGPVMRIVSHLAMFAAALVVGWLFTRTFVNWLGIDFWQDIRAYEANFEDEYYFYQALNVDFLQFFSKEIGWIYLVQLVKTDQFTTQEALYILSILSGSVIFFYVIKSSGSYITPIFLVNPIFIDFIVGQNRSSVAASIFFVGLLFKRPFLQIPFFVIASSVHFSIPLFAAIYYLYRFLNWREVRFFLGVGRSSFIAIGVLFAFLAENFKTYILYTLEDRRFESLLGHEPSILLATGFCLFVLSFLFLEQKKQVSMQLFFYTTCAALFMFATLNGLYASRYVAIAFPMLCILQSSLEGWRRWLFSLHLLSFSAVYFTFWL